MSSLVTLAFVRLWTWLKMRRRYGSLAGNYSVEKLDGMVVEGETTTLRHEGGRLFSTCSTRHGREDWSGYVTMSDELPGVGSGLYQFRDLHGCGLHYLQVNAKDGSIFVRGINTVGGTTDQPFVYTLRRQRTLVRPVD
ncbi:MAG TPA: hypothetical protein VHR66_20245 [Gemmataceae bacterium]|nr:hypothetical protein [Gemmataceae bacterium]